jgi:hypothetical protein
MSPLGLSEWNNDIGNGLLKTLSQIGIERGEEVEKE